MNTQNSCPTPLNVMVGFLLAALLGVGLTGCDLEIVGSGWHPDPNRCLHVRINGCPREPGSINNTHTPVGEAYVLNAEMFDSDTGSWVPAEGASWSVGDYGADVELEAFGIGSVRATPTTPGHVFIKVSASHTKEDGEWCYGREYCQFRSEAFDVTIDGCPDEQASPIGESVALSAAAFDDTGDQIRDGLDFHWDLSGEPCSYDLAVLDQAADSAWVTSNEACRIELELIVSHEDHSVFRHCEFIVKDNFTYAAGMHPTSVAIADLDGVNGPDIVVANKGGLTANALQMPTVSVLLNRGDGLFVEQVIYVVWEGPGLALGTLSLAIADLDGVNGPDLAVAKHALDDVSVLLNRGDGTFEALASYPTDTGPTSLAIADMDGVNGPDLAVTCQEGNVLTVLLNQGAGTFAMPANYATGGRPLSVAIADLDGMNGSDLAVTNYDSQDVSVLFNQGAGTFAWPVVYATAGPPLTITILEGNSGSDLAAVTWSSDSTWVATTLMELVNDGAGHSSRSVAVADLDGMNGPDVVTTNSRTDEVWVRLNVGDGTYAEPIPYGAWNGPSAVVIGDLDRVNGPDLVVGQLASGDVSVFLNNGQGQFTSRVAQ